MLPHIGPQIVTDGIGVPLRPSQQMLDPIRGHISIDFGQLPPVFALDRAEKAPEIRPSMPPGFASRKLCPNPSLDLGEPQRPFAYKQIPENLSRKGCAPIIGEPRGVTWGAYIFVVFL